MSERSELIAPDCDRPEYDRWQPSEGASAWRDDSFAPVDARIDAVLIGASMAMHSVRTLIAKVAPTALSVLIEGETGVGKERVAEAVHAASERTGALVPVNVSAISEGVFESELFGHVEGAFTGAVGRRVGFCAEADQGTLFLDEIGTLPAAMQSKLLRVLETGRFYPVGASRERASRFRVVSATNVELERHVASGHFREDLRHRLAGMVIRVPPLRERPEDIPALVRHFLARSSMPAGGQYRLSEQALALLGQHPWPGNVRELKHVVARSLVLTTESVVSAEVVAEALGYAEVRHGGPGQRVGRDAVGNERDVVSRLLVALDEAAGDTAVAARLLGVSRNTVYRWMRAAGLETPRRRRGGGPGAGVV